MATLVLAHGASRSGPREDPSQATVDPFRNGGSRRTRTFLSLLLAHASPRILARILEGMRRA